MINFRSQEATSKTWTRTLDPDPKKTGAWKAWTLKNLDPEKYESWKTSNKYGIKNMYVP